MTLRELEKVDKKVFRENFRFRMFLKFNADEDELDEQFAALHEELFADYDCCACNNCCRLYNLTLTEDDARQIAEFKGIRVEELIKDYAENEEDSYTTAAPCPFLEKDGKCQIQNCKPTECIGFPYTNHPNRMSSLTSVMEYSQTCPVVFEIIQRLKDIYMFNKRPAMKVSGKKIRQSRG
jgi:hypothetical protein